MSIQASSKEVERTPFQSPIRVLVESGRILKIPHLSNVLQLHEDMPVGSACPFYVHPKAGTDEKTQFGVVVNDDRYKYDPVYWLADVKDYGKIDEDLEKLAAENKCQLYYPTLHSTEVDVALRPLILVDGTKFIIGSGSWDDEMKFHWIMPANAQSIIPTITRCDFKAKTILVSDIPTILIFSTADGVDRFEHFIADLRKLHGKRSSPY